MRWMMRMSGIGILERERRTAGFVIFPSWMGTLKSTRMRTFLLLRSRSVMESLLEIDIAVEAKAKRSRA
jgi:hypothetical protein